LAVIGFSYIVESWSIINSLYYATVLFCTIGFGDIEPTNTYGQVYTIFLAIYGIAFLGILLGAVIDYCLEYHHVQSEQSRRHVGTQVLHQMKEKETMKQQQNTILMDETIEPTNNSNTHSNPSLWDEIIKLIIFEIPVLTLAIGMAILIGHFEGWTIFECIYWFVISGCTVGFGDYYPHLIYSKLVCVFYLPFAVAVVGDLLGRIVTIYMDRKRRSAEKLYLQRSLSLVDLDVMDVDHSGRVDKFEFLSYMLCALQKVSKDDVNEIIDLFHKLDLDKNNYLTKSDLIAKEWEQSFRTTIQQSIPS
jgi:potassium channel subfamily K, other eukaryote